MSALIASGASKDAHPPEAADVLPAAGRPAPPRLTLAPPVPVCGFVPDRLDHMACVREPGHEGLHHVRAVTR